MMVSSWLPWGHYCHSIVILNAVRTQCRVVDWSTLVPCFGTWKGMREYVAPVRIKPSQHFSVTLKWQQHPGGGHKDTITFSLAISKLTEHGWAGKLLPSNCHIFFWTEKTLENSVWVQVVHKNQVGLFCHSSSLHQYMNKIEVLITVSTVEERSNYHFKNHI